MRKLLLIVILSLLSAQAFSAPELKGSPQELKGFLYPNDKIVTIRGEAEEKAYSDKAIVSLVISTEGTLLSEAIASNGQLRQEITTSLIAAGINPQAIKSSKFSSSPQYGWFGSKPSSYKVVNRMAVAINNESHLKDIALVADRSDDIELSDTAFEHSLKEEYNAKVKQKALDNILKQKQFYETTLGVKLIPVGVRDTHTRQRATRGAMVLEEVVVTAAKRGAESDSVTSRYRNEPQEPSFDEVKYEAEMAVDFKIGG